MRDFINDLFSTIDNQFFQISFFNNKFFNYDIFENVMKTIESKIAINKFVKHKKNIKFEKTTIDVFMKINNENN